MRKIFVGGVQKSGSSAVVSWLHDQTGITTLRGDLTETRLVTWPAGIGALCQRAISEGSVSDPVLNLHYHLFSPTVTTRDFMQAYGLLNGQRRPETDKNLPVALALHRNGEVKAELERFIELFRVSKVADIAAGRWEQLNELLDSWAYAVTGDRDIAVLFNNDPNCVDLACLQGVQNASFLGVLRDPRGMFWEHVQLGLREPSRTQTYRFIDRMERKYARVLEAAGGADLPPVRFVWFEDFVRRQEVRALVAAYLGVGLGEPCSSFSEKRALRSLRLHRRVGTPELTRLLGKGTRDMVDHLNVSLRENGLLIE